MSRDIREFVPQDEKNITIYCCGITPHDTAHLGNFRPAVIFDVLIRFLRLTYGNNVTYARNITDIDDKIINNANKNNETIEGLTNRVINQYHSNLYELNVLPPTYEPRVTANMGEIINTITRIMANGNAYVSENNVLFDIESHQAHGKLSRHEQQNLETGQHRVALADYKSHDGDFILWKPAKEGEPYWDSPWGKGRCGWHIECSTFIETIFNNNTIDIHGGGADLRFPHHECEISQFESCSHKPLANYWIHNAMLTVDGQKMAKSAGNFITAQNLLNKGIPGPAIRLALLTAHYRSPLNWTTELIDQSVKTLTDWHRALEMVETDAEENEHARYILEPLNHDLNMPLVIAHLHEKMSEIASDPAISAGVRFAGEILGFDLSVSSHDQYLRGLSNRAEINQLVADRIAARSRKDWAESDRIRNLLNDMGLTIEDTSSGTSWRRS